MCRWRSFKDVGIFEKNTHTDGMCNNTGVLNSAMSSTVHEKELARLGYNPPNHDVKQARFETSVMQNTGENYVGTADKQQWKFQRGLPDTRRGSGRTVPTIDSLSEHTHANGIVGNCLCTCPPKQGFGTCFNIRQNASRVPLNRSTSRAMLAAKAEEKVPPSTPKISQCIEVESLASATCPRVMVSCTWEFFASSMMCEKLRLRNCSSISLNLQSNDRDQWLCLVLVWFALMIGSSMNVHQCNAHSLWLHTGV